MSKYPFDFVIETTHGIYPVGHWAYMSHRETQAQAEEDCKRLGEEYRVVDSSGNVLYPDPQAAVPDTEGET